MNNKHYSIQQLLPLAKNLTAYAVANGYEGLRPVLVLDGKVISHQSVNWFDFCTAVRRVARRRTSGSTALRSMNNMHHIDNKSLGIHANSLAQAPDNAQIQPRECGTPSRVTACNAN